MVNGYGDIYTDAELARNFRIDGGSPGWVADVKGLDARYALLRTGSELAYGLQTLQDWDGAGPQRRPRPARGPGDWPTRGRLTGPSG